MNWPQTLLRLGNALSRPLLARLDPERAHQLTIATLSLMPLPEAGPDDDSLGISAFGLYFPNPLGVAAGADKDGLAAKAFLKLGFGFTEAGSITPLPQPGNPRPRLFRLPRDHAVINRFGFNSKGFDAVRERLLRIDQGYGIVGINLGANKNSEDRVEDYVSGISAFADCASYFTINISSPNTDGLRGLQQQSALNGLLSRVLDAREKYCLKPTPILLKIAPDLTVRELDNVITCARSRRIDGMIVSNTTISRPSDLREPAARETGGLSGRPLFLLSTQKLAETYLRVENQFPLIGAGGVENTATAFAKIEAGASLVQFYTCMTYRGLTPLGEIKRGILRRLAQNGQARLRDAVGMRAKDWADAQ